MLRECAAPQSDGGRARAAQAELAQLGLACEFIPVPINVAEEEWMGVARKYWHGRETYYLPIAQLPRDTEGEGE